MGQWKCCRRGHGTWMLEVPHVRAAQRKDLSQHFRFARIACAQAHVIQVKTHFPINACLRACRSEQNSWPRRPCVAESESEDVISGRGDAGICSRKSAP
jgi:hypothetical protein